MNHILLSLFNDNLLDESLTTVLNEWEFILVNRIWFHYHYHYYHLLLPTDYAVKQLK